MKHDRRTVTRMGLAAIAASSALVLGACGGNGGGNGNNHQGFQSHVGSYVPGQGGSNAGAGNAGGGNSGGSAALASSCVPSSQVLDNTHSYDGKEVTITGTVAQVVSQHAFTVAASTNNNGNNSSNNSNTARTLLAVDNQATQPSPGSPVQVTGTLQPSFNSSEAATFTGGNLGQGAFNPFNGKPYVQAEFAGPISANLTQGAQSGGTLSRGNNSSSSCAAVTDVLNNARSYDGKQVTITGTIAQVLGSHAITVAASGNNANRAQTLLAVGKQAMPVVPGSRVQVTGTLQPAFNANQAETFTGSNLDPATFGPFNGKPYVQAVFAGPASANLTGSNNQS